MFSLLISDSVDDDWMNERVSVYAALVERHRLRNDNILWKTFPGTTLSTRDPTKNVVGTEPVRFLFSLPESPVQ